MKFNPGDHVSFINEKQDGTIIKVLSNGNVVVLTTDGFEIRVSDKELVKRIVQEETPLISAPASSPEYSIDDQADIIKTVEEDDIAFVTVPERTGAVLTGEIHCYLVNRSKHPAAFTFYLKKGKKYEGHYIGTIQPEASDLVFRSSRSDLTDIESYFIEALVLNHERPHLRKELPVMVPDLQSVRTGISGAVAFAKTISLIRREQPATDALETLKDHFEKGDQQSYRGSKGHKNPRGIIINEKIVDLHIEELLDHFSHLTNSEMLTEQMKRFTREMNEARENHYQKVTFIHGVGSGVLKNAIRDELSYYSDVRFSDADPAKFGYGATDVFF